MRVLDLSRLRASVVVLLAVVTTLLIVDVIVRVSVGNDPPRLTRSVFLNADQRATIGGRISGVERERRGEAHAKPVAVIIGFSTARAGLLPSVLDASDPAGRQWLNIASSGGSFYELSYYLPPLTWSALEPDLVVIGVHPAFMAGRSLEDEDPEGALQSAMKRGSWLLANRNRLNITVRRALGDARARLFLGLGFALDVLFPPPADPWAMKRNSFQGHGSADALAYQMHGWERLGWFEPAHYESVATERDAANAVVRACQAKAKRVVVVLMPESSTLRARMPPIAEAEFRKSLEGLPVEILDLRDAMLDDAFFDYAHLNELGGPQFSKLFLDKLDAR